MIYCLALFVDFTDSIPPWSFTFTCWTVCWNLCCSRLIGVIRSVDSVNPSSWFLLFLLVCHTIRPSSQMFRLSFDPGSELHLHLVGRFISVNLDSQVWTVWSFEIKVSHFYSHKQNSSFVHCSGSRQECVLNREIPTFCIKWLLLKHRRTNEAKHKITELHFRHF